jgi:hypothetical protein
MPIGPSRLRYAVVAFVGVLQACSGSSQVDAVDTDSGGPGAHDGGGLDASHDAPSGRDAGAPDVGITQDAQPDVSIDHEDSGPTDDAGDLMVTWGTACWDVEGGHKYQAIPFQLVTSSPIPLEATLYFTTDCDASNGTDNLNDTGGTIGSGGWLFSFIHHPDMPDTSAIWSLGSQTSGCVDYSKAPDCN